MKESKLKLCSGTGTVPMVVGGELHHQFRPCAGSCPVGEPTGALMGAKVGSQG
jgi:hypothetical protein